MHSVNSSTIQYENISIKKDNSSFIGSMSPSKISHDVSYFARGLSYDNSASTLQHSALSTKFPKAERFPIQKSYSQSQLHLLLPSTLSPKATSLGYGNKKIMSEAALRASLETPSPDHYHPKLWTDKNKGKSFGIHYDAYKKVYLPHTHVVLPEIASKIPGPGTYNIKDGFSFNGKGYTLKPRGKMFNEVSGERAPPSGHYKPNLSLVEPSRYHKITFGVGGRSDFTKEGSQSPGPGTYQLSSKFDSYKKRRLIQDKLKERLKGLKE